MASLTRRPGPLLEGSRALVRQAGYRCSFSVRFPLRLDCESWDGEPSLDWAGFVVVELVLISASRPPRAMVYVIIFSP